MATRDNRSERSALLSQSHGSEETLPNYESIPGTPIEEVVLNKVSRADLIWILAGLWSAVFLGALDGTIVATLLTAIGSHFNKSHLQSYIGTSYLLSVCCFTPLYGRLSDILGRKGAMLLGLSLFGSGTLLCGIAPSMETFIAARAIAGMGGGGVMTVSSVAVTDLIPLKQRGLYQGLANVLFGLGAGLGGPIGGWMNDAFGWRSAFLFQVPILCISFALVAVKVNIKLPLDVQNRKPMDKLRRIDFLGSVTLVAFVGCLLLGFSLKTSEELPWSHPWVVGLFIASVVFGVMFFLVESYWSTYPVMPLHLITRRTPLAVSLANFFGSVVAFSTLYNVPLYFSAVRLESAADSGLHLLPHSVSLSIGSLFAGWYMRSTGKLYTLSLISAGLSIIACTLEALWDDNSSAATLWLAVIPQGFGMASLLTTTLIAIIASVVKDELAVATGITYLFRTTGQVLGVSMSGAIIQAVLFRKLRATFTQAGDTELIDKIRHSTEFIRTLDPLRQKQAVDCYASALRVVFICQIAVQVFCFMACLPIQENPLASTHEEQEAQFRRNEEER